MLFTRTNRTPRQGSGCHIWRKFSSPLPVPVSLVIFLLIQSHHHYLGTEAQGILENQQAQAQNTLHNRANLGNKIGLAPHDRPACQLAPIAAQRRHLAAASSTTGGAAASATGDQLNGLFSEQVNISAPANSFHAGSILAPNVISLQRPSTLMGLEMSLPGSVGKRVKKVDSSERLRQLRQLLVSNQYDAYLVTPHDEHGSEYVGAYDQRLRFISGFTGSNGFALVLLDRAVFFTDGRYALQSDAELDCNWSLVVGDNQLNDMILWLKANAAKGLKVAMDARLMSLKDFDKLDGELKKLDSEFALISQDLIDVVWSNNLAETAERHKPRDPLFVHPLQFTGNVSWQEKLVRLADSMGKLRARHYIISQLEDIAWILNLRGNDIAHTPLFKAYLFISRWTPEAETATLPAQQHQATSVEQLLAASLTSQQSQHHNHQQHLHTPQVVQVPASQVIRVTLYVDLEKVGPEVREHLHVHQNGTTTTNNYHLYQRPNAQRPPSVRTQNANYNGDQWNYPATPLSGEQNNHSTVATRIHVELKDYDVFIMDIREKLSGGSAPPAPAASEGALASGNERAHQQLGSGRLLLDANSNVAIHVLAKSHADRMVLLESLVNKLKAVKSDSEVQGMRQAHWRDSLAISMLLGQLELDIGERQLVNKWSETSAASELEFYRSLMDYNRGQSFPTISAYGSNAAIVHYSPSQDGQERQAIGNQSTYLLDSGGQYLDGTTDITRTVHYGEASEFQRETYTRVLMGAIDAMSLIFEGPTRSAYMIKDLQARQPLLEIGLTFAHGTGHGIGLYSLVHEAPSIFDLYTRTQQSSQALLSMKQQCNEQQAVQLHSDPLPLQANMFTSVEPGYYKANDFGIRLENIVVSQRVRLPSSLARPNDRQQEPPGAEGHFLRFEPLSLVPFEPKLIKLELLSNKQKAWLNSYNLMVRFRMTEQINHYLKKIRQFQASTAPPNGSGSNQAQLAGSQIVQIQGTASSSRLYQQLQLNNATTTAATLIAGASAKPTSGQEQNLAYLYGLQNFRRMDGAQLEAKLEQTHRWIMAKTELIPLDVPQALVAPQTSTQSGPASGPQRAGKRDSEPQSGAAGGPDGQRLMLAYMSSLPFGDPGAAEASAAIARQEALSGRGALAAGGNSSGQQPGAAHCSGLQCDLWLLSAISPPTGQQQLLRQRSRPPATTASSGSEATPASRLRSWDELTGEPSEQASDASSASALADLFRLGSSDSQRVRALGGSSGLWPVLAALLAAVAATQLVMLAYLWRRGQVRGGSTLASAGVASSGPSAVQLA